MINKAHLVMPMAGAGSRFNNKEFELPKPLIEIAGMPFFYWATRSLEKNVPLLDIVYVVLQEHVGLFGIDRIIKKHFPSARIIILPEITKGPVFTCLEGVRLIDDDKPVIFNDCDHMFRCSQLDEILNGSSDIDGALLTFKSAEPHFSYIRYEKNHVIGTIEKVVVSDQAICGAYYFKSAKLFKCIAKEYIVNCSYKEPFLSGMYNIMCDKGMNVEAFPVDFHVEFGTPEEYTKAKQSKFFDEII